MSANFQVKDNGDIVIKGLTDEEVVLVNKLFNVDDKEFELVNDLNDQRQVKLEVNGISRYYNTYSNNTIEIQNLR